MSRDALSRLITTGLILLKRQLGCTLSFIISRRRVAHESERCMRMIRISASRNIVRRLQISSLLIGVLRANKRAAEGGNRQTNRTFCANKQTPINLPLLTFSPKKTANQIRLIPCVIDSHYKD